MELIPEPGGPGSTDPIPQQWTVSTANEGVELKFSPSRWVPEVVVGTGMVAFFGYWAAVFLYQWIFGGEQVVVAGVVLFLLLLAGLGSGFYVLDGMLDATTRYDLRTHSLAVTEQCLFRNSKTEIDRSQVTEVMQVVTPPQAAADRETWRTVLTYRSPLDDQPSRLVLAGYSQQESDWLAPLLAHWSGVALRRHRSDH
jgi:hypothetical protein